MATFSQIAVGNTLGRELNASTLNQCTRRRVAKYILAGNCVTKKWRLVCRAAAPKMSGSRERAHGCLALHPGGF